VSFHFLLRVPLIIFYNILQARHQKFGGVTTECPVLFLKTLLTTSNPAPDLSDTLGRLADFKDRTSFRRFLVEGVHETGDVNGDLSREAYEDPPEATQFNARRVCIALTNQIIARYFTISSESAEHSSVDYPCPPRRSHDLPYPSHDVKFRNV